MLNRRGRESPFSLEQDAHIESFFPALLAEPASTVASWKETTAQEILLSPLFRGKLPSQAEDNKKGADEKEWKAASRMKTHRREKKFGNRLNAEAKKGKSPSTTAFLTFAPLSAKSLFEVESRPFLEAEAIEQVSETKRRMAVCYPICVEERWNGLDEAKRTAYQMRADNTPQSVLTNQVDFPRAAQAALTALCRGGQVGKLELMTFWAYRESDGILRHGIIDAHASDDVPNMADTPDWEERAYELWQQFADKVVPFFPTCDLQSQPPKNYLTELWGKGVISPLVVRTFDSGGKGCNGTSKLCPGTTSLRTVYITITRNSDCLFDSSLPGRLKYHNFMVSLSIFMAGPRQTHSYFVIKLRLHDSLVTHQYMPAAHTELEVEQTENNFGKPIEGAPAPEEVPPPEEVPVPNVVLKKRGRPPRAQSGSKIPSPKKQKPNPVDIPGGSSMTPERPKRVIPPKKSHVNHDSGAKVKPSFEIRLYAYDEKGNRGEEIREQRQPDNT
ncbi:hypothetical protein GGX14DRAFT_391044 [Mycena pura]|uniref:Uncharacterized protein n=1 Tax=Mycena pura TaxID=153505 RepID=A0AAD6VNR1_9AGAR|nr:hypothetical protein GGX14DRAFT_391044 [Mycena pura]